LVVPSIVHEEINSPADPLDATTLGAMQPRFGNLQHVRVHTSARAAASADAIGAAAYTFGRDVVFGTGQYRPNSQEGRNLLAHELTHIVQQKHIHANLRGIAPREDPAERQACALTRGTSEASPGLLYRQEKASPPPQPTSVENRVVGSAQSNQSTQEAQGKAPASAQGDLRARVRAWLDNETFNLGLVLDARPKPPEQWHVFYAGQRMTLSEVTDETWAVLNQQIPGLKRGDVWSEVYQYYQEKERKIDPSQWQGVLQLLWTPTLNIASTQPGPRFQGPGQLTLGATYQAHKQGYLGLEHQFALTASGLDFFSGQKNYFENALLQYQLSLVSPVGHDFQIGATWANLQASLSAQAAIGLGGDTDPSRGGKIFLGLFVQPGVGGQLTLNIGSFQIIAQGTVVYSWFSKTDKPGSEAASTLAVQGGLGVGASF
jgi:hypothetical protein